MAPAGTTNAAGRPKRKRQRRRRANADSDDDLDLSSSSSESDASSSDSDSDSDKDTPATKNTNSAPATAKATGSEDSSDDSSDEDSGADSDSSSGSDLSFLSDGGADPDARGRRGRGRRRAAQEQEAAAITVGGSAAAGAGSGQADSAAAHARRPYPERSPSPSLLARADPSAFVPLGTSLFPLLEKRVPKSAATSDEAEDRTRGERVLEGLIEGDDMVERAEQEPTTKEAGKKREDRFGEWWRARLVSEFEGDLGGLAAEPGLTPSRLQLLLTSLTTLSSLHTSSAIPAAARSIWSHDASASLDPLASLPASASGEDPVEWAATKVGGAGDVEVGEEGVVADERRSAKAKAKKERRKSAPVPESVKMVVDAGASATAAPTSSPIKKEKKDKKRKGRKSGASEAGDRMEVDE